MRTILKSQIPSKKTLCLGERKKYLYPLTNRCMKKLLTTAIIALLCGTFSPSFSQAIISTMTITPANPTNCTETTASINLTLYCANYTYTGATVTTSGSNITIQLDYTVGLICLPAFQYPTVNVNLGQLNPGSVTIQAYAYLNSTFSSASSPFNTTVIPCCGAVAAFTPAEDTICQGESIQMTNTTINADSVKWYVDWNFVDTAFNPTITFDSAGYQEVSLVAFSDTCNDTTEHFIQVYPAPALDLGNDTSICAGDELNLSIPGNLNSILWSDGNTTNTNSFNAVGTYWVQANSNQGCTGSDTISISAVLPISSVDLGPDLIICPNTPTNLPAGGTYASYLWSTGDTTSSITISNTGTFWLEANVAGECPGRDTIEVFNYTVIPLDFNDDSTKCGNNTVGTWGTYSSYLWSTGSTQSTETFEDSTLTFLTVTDANGCEQSDSFEVAVWPIPVVDLGEDTYYCPGEELILESNIGGTYEWSTGSTSSLIAVTSAGTYWLGVTNEEGCTGHDTVIIDFCLGQDELKTTSFSIWPNPTKEWFELRGTAKIESADLFDLTGKHIARFQTEAAKQKINVAHLSSGVYILSITHDGGNEIRRLIIE